MDTSPMEGGPVITLEHIPGYGSKPQRLALMPLLAYIAMRGMPVVCPSDPTRREPRVAISITDRDNPYRTAMILGRVLEQRNDEDGTVMNATARRYTGNPYPWNGPCDERS